GGPFVVLGRIVVGSARRGGRAVVGGCRRDAVVGWGRRHAVVGRGRRSAVGRGRRSVVGRGRRSAVGRRRRSAVVERAGGARALHEVREPLVTVGADERD